METIFESIKKLLGFDQSYNAFDLDLMTNTQSAFGVLVQLGVIDYSVTIDHMTKWSDLNIPGEILGMVKEYIFLKSKIIFDPPSNGTIAAAYNSRIDELEWRLNVAVDPGRSEV